MDVICIKHTLHHTTDGQSDNKHNVLLQIKCYDKCLLPKIVNNIPLLTKTRKATIKSVIFDTIVLSAIWIFCKTYLQILKEKF